MAVIFKMQTLHTDTSQSLSTKKGQKINFTTLNVSVCSTKHKISDSIGDNISIFRVPPLLHLCMLLISIKYDYLLVLSSN